MYILRYYIKSRYENYTREIEETFDDYLLLVNFIIEKKLKDYEVFIKYKEGYNVNDKGNKKI